MFLPPAGMDAATYEALPDETCKYLEVIDGAVLVHPGPTRRHQNTVRHLANELERICGSALAITTSADLRLRDEPLLIRKPDIVAHDLGLPDDAVLRPAHCRLVVEVVSACSATADRIDKPAEYAAAGIERFWRVEGDRQPMTFRYRLDPATKRYAEDALDPDDFGRHSDRNQGHRTHRGPGTRWDADSPPSDHMSRPRSRAGEEWVRPPTAR
ncbi:Uma2 family endonuclease [Saccharopolyspora hirsuta]|uniref:Uma2 family endonuclease n=1 Tax=Saccharopolyspora hirsuta TaxID=1837 RepID=A0A5M7BQG1_SACHI|nr:Uma2 family endonuclease [Saccharopolyspora hirsuta]